MILTTISTYQAWLACEKVSISWRTPVDGCKLMRWFHCCWNTKNNILKGANSTTAGSCCTVINLTVVYPPLYLRLPEEISFYLAGSAVYWRGFSSPALYYKAIWRDLNCLDNPQHHTIPIYWLYHDDQILWRGSGKYHRYLNKVGKGPCVQSPDTSPKFWGAYLSRAILAKVNLKSYIHYIIYY